MDAQVKREIALLTSSITDLQNRVRALEEYDADDYEESSTGSDLDDDEAYNSGRSELLDALLPVIEIAIRHDKHGVEHHLRLAGLVGDGGISLVERLLL